MSSLRLEGVKFVVYPQDHIPRHVHAFCGEAEVIIDLNDEEVSVALRREPFGHETPNEATSKKHYL